MLGYTTIEKKVGETPLETAERLRESLRIPAGIPLAYAGRLDPMASGKLLVLIGDECKVQEKYHDFDKRYVVEVLIGAHSDTGDVLGLVQTCISKTTTERKCAEVLNSLRGDIELPYPHFSSRTVKGKPLHTWALEGRLREIEIPAKHSTIHSLRFLGLRTVTKAEAVATASNKIETIPKVVDERKALGADFRRCDVRKAWAEVAKNEHDTFQVLTFSCIASSGTYMRSLAGLIGEKLGSCGLAYSIHRTHIGTYLPLFHNFGIWLRSF